MTQQTSFQFLLAQTDKHKADRLAVGGGDDTAFLGVGLRGKTYHIPVGQIREIVPNPKITAIGHAKSWLTGLLKVQGEIYSVIDVAQLLGLPEEESKLKLAIALSVSGGNYAIVISSVLGIVRVNHLHEVDSDEYTVSYQVADDTDNVMITLCVPSIIRSSELTNMSIF